MNITQLDSIVGRVTYDRGAVVLECGDDGNGLWVEVGHYRRDTRTGERGFGRGGKRRISSDANESQVVRTIFGALLALEEHEAREAFHYRGAQVFGPHIAVDALVEVADRVDYAEPARAE